MTEKKQKTCLNTKQDDFDQQTECEAPVGWSKCTIACKYPTINENQNLKNCVFYHAMVIKLNFQGKPDAEV